MPTVATTSTPAPATNATVTARLRDASQARMAARRLTRYQTTRPATIAPTTSPANCTHCGTVVSRNRVTAATPPGSGDSTMIESGGCTAGACCSAVTPSGVGMTALACSSDHDGVIGSPTPTRGTGLRRAAWPSANRRAHGGVFTRRSTGNA